MTDGDTLIELIHDGRRHEIRRGAAVAGRGDHCELQVVHPLVSREHARFEVRPEGFFVFDLGSHNGTWVDARRIDGVMRLRTGDRVRLGAEGAEFVVVRALLVGVDMSERSAETDAATADLGDPRSAVAPARVVVRSPPPPPAQPDVVPPPVRTDCVRPEPAARRPPPPPFEMVPPSVRPGLPLGRFVAGLLLGAAAVAALAVFTDFPERLDRVLGRTLESGR